MKGRIRTFKRLAQTADLNNPEQVLLSLAKLNWKNRTKNTFVDTYGAYLKFKKIQWERPKYENEERLPFISTENELDKLIYASQRKMATLLQLLKEMGMRISEAKGSPIF